MTNDELIVRIANAGIKQVIRKYPYIVSGEFIETFDVNYTHLYNPNNLPVTGLRIIFWIDPEIFFSMFPKNSYLYNSITNKTISSTTRYLTSLYDKDSEGFKELDSLDGEIMGIFYKTAHIMNGDRRLGLLDFFVRFAFLGSDISDDFVGFTDWDMAYPPKQYYLKTP